MEPTILQAIEQICQEKKLSKEIVLGAIEQALAAAYRRDYGHKNQNIKVEFNPENGSMRVFDVKTVVEDLPKETKEKTKEETGEKRRFNPKTEIQLSEAKKINKNIKVGETLITELPLPTGFGRVAAQTAKQVIVQRLREAERQTIFERYKSQEGKIITGVIQRKEKNMVLVDLPDITALLPPSEQILEEKYIPGQKMQFYLQAVKQTTKGPEIILSRRHPEIIRELFKQEIPEIANGIVEIKAVAREAGSRAKVAVWTKEKGVDPVGACIGQKGVRIQTIIAQLGGEKIDIIEWDEDPKKFVANALSPAKIQSLELDEKNKKAIIKTKEEHLSLAIGRAGQNIRLASRLTGYEIEVQTIPKEEKEKTEEKEKGAESGEEEKDLKEN
jgi:N utilization substance protein A